MTMSALPNTCREVLANISGYLDGELDTTACEAIEKHRISCPNCAAIIEGLRETVGLCRQAATVPLPDAVRRRALARVRQLLDRDDDERTDG
jgi:anti-sigma factor RsiW